MRGEYKDFIGVYKNVLPKGYCAHMIEEYERLAKLGYSKNRMESDNVFPALKSDTHIFVNFGAWSVSDFEGDNPHRLFFEVLGKAYEEYSIKYSPLNRHSASCKNIKMQKTSEAEGFHIWHYENGAGANTARAVTYMLYLNTIEGSGETEFLYQGRRIPPVENTLILWPAGYTHSHRGNPVYGNTAKYVLTGWFYYDQ